MEVLVELLQESVMVAAEYLENRPLACKIDQTGIKETLHHRNYLRDDIRYSSTDYFTNLSRTFLVFMNTISSFSRNAQRFCRPTFPTKKIFRISLRFNPWGINNYSKNLKDVWREMPSHFKEIVKQIFKKLNPDDFLNKNFKLFSKMRC